MNLVKLDFKTEQFKKDNYDFDISAETVAEELGLTVVYPAPNQLQFDIDSDEDYSEMMNRCRKMFEDHWDINYSITASSSGLPHRHVILTFIGHPGFTEWQRIALQSVLGSDPIRELLNAKRAMDNPKGKPCRLFETESAIEEQKASLAKHPYSKDLEDIFN